MPSDWRLLALGHLCDSGVPLIQTGPFGSQLHAYDYRSDGIPVVPTEAIQRRRIKTEGLPRISSEKADELQRHRLQVGDILFARRGVQATGLSALVTSELEGAICGTGAILLRIRGTDVDPQFLSMTLASDATVNWLKAHAVGAVMPNLNESILRLLPLTLPPMCEQRGIASIVRGLDDKIELNRRMNQTLEAMAQALFRSWFVEFDPVRAKADGRKPEGMDAETAALFPNGLVDSPIGPIPEGWSLAALSEVMYVNPPRVLPRGAQAPYLDMANMPTSTARAGDVVTREFGSGMRFINGDTLVARITPCLENGKTALVDFLQQGEVGWGSTEYIVLRPREPLPTQFGYFLARTDEFRRFAIGNMTGTSGRQRVPADCLNRFRIAVPPPALGSRFGDLVQGFMARMKANDLEARTLAQLRDLLLPKFLSGELRVRDAEAQLEATA